MKKAREGSPGGGSPASSGPGSARSPGLEEGEDAPQLAVKREFASGRDNPSRQEAEDEDGSNQGQGNLLDCLMQVKLPPKLYLSLTSCSLAGWSKPYELWWRELRRGGRG